MDNIPTQTAGTSAILASDWNTYVRDNFDSLKFGHLLATEATPSDTRPSGVAAGTMVFTTDTNTMWVYNGSSWVRAVNTASLQDNAVTTGKVNDGAITGAKIANGYTFVQTVVFASNGTFTKASYSWLRALKVRLQAGGGAGGGAASTDSSTIAMGGGGGGGAYAERFVTNIAGLSASETITVGGGGTAGTGNGGAGGNTTAFGITVNGGSGGTAGAAVSSMATAGGSGGGLGSGTVDLVVAGSDGGYGRGISNFVLAAGYGGSSALAGSREGPINANGNAGRVYGGGGSGGATGAFLAGPRNGGAGGAGIVIVDLFA